MCQGRDLQESGPALGVKMKDCSGVTWGEEGRKREAELVKHGREGRVEEAAAPLKGSQEVLNANRPC